jgi:hypothetical protein
MDADDVTRTVTLARDALSGAADLDWQVPAGTLRWTCWETVEHMSDVLFGYAAQISAAPSARTTYVPFGWQRRRDGAPEVTVYGDLCAGALRRLFPDAPAGGDPWGTLLDVTGRGAVALDSWKWDGTPR